MNDTKKFFKAFARDRQVFGEELTIGLYEDIFSFLLNKKVDGFDKVSSIIDEDGYLETGLEEEMLSEGLLNKITNFFKKPQGEALLPSFLDQALNSKDDKAVNSIAGKLDKMMGATPSGRQVVDTVNAAKEAEAFTPGIIEIPEKAVQNAINAANGATGFSGWISNSWNKIKTFFQGNNIKKLLSKGLTWITNPTNAATVLGSAGGLILLTLVIKSLKKRHQLNKFRRLKEFNDRTKYLEKENLKESAEDNEVVYEIVEECKTNERLRKLFYEDDPFAFETKNSYLDY